MAEPEAIRATSTTTTDSQQSSVQDHSSQETKTSVAMTAPKKRKRSNVDGSGAKANPEYKKVPIRMFHGEDRIDHDPPEQEQEQEQDLVDRKFDEEKKDYPFAKNWAGWVVDGVKAKAQATDHVDAGSLTGEIDDSQEEMEMDILSNSSKDIEDMMMTNNAESEEQLLDKLRERDATIDRLNATIQELEEQVDDLRERLAGVQNDNAQAATNSNDQSIHAQGLWDEEFPYVDGGGASLPIYNLSIQIGQILNRKVGLEQLAQELSSTLEEAEQDLEYSRLRHNQYLAMIDGAYAAVNIRADKITELAAPPDPDHIDTDDTDDGSATYGISEEDIDLNGTGETRITSPEEEDD